MVMVKRSRSSHRSRDLLTVYGPKGWKTWSTGQWPFAVPNGVRYHLLSGWQGGCAARPTVVV
jgi:hypothetical protein